MIRENKSRNTFYYSSSFGAKGILSFKYVLGNFAVPNHFFVLTSKSFKNVFNTRAKQENKLNLFVRGGNSECLFCSRNNTKCWY